MICMAELFRNETGSERLRFEVCPDGEVMVYMAAKNISSVGVVSMTDHELLEIAKRLVRATRRNIKRRSAEEVKRGSVS